jgi:hypothetical protein
MGKLNRQPSACRMQAKTSLRRGRLMPWHNGAAIGTHGPSRHRVSARMITAQTTG